MKKMVVFLSTLAMLLSSQFVRAEVYTYTGPNFTSVSGGYTTSMSVTASITTSAPIPPDQTAYPIGGLVTSWSVSDGFNTLQGPDPGSLLVANVDTNSSGQIVGGWVGAFTLPMRTKVGDIQDWIVTDSSAPLNQGIDDLECIEDDGNGTCTNNTSAAHGDVSAYGTWTGGSIADPTYSVGGSVSGLTGTGLELQNNGGDTLAVAAAATDFTFATELLDLATYAVTVLTQPADQTCTVTNESGMIAAADVTNVAVTCVDNPTYPVTVVVTGLLGTGNADDNVDLQNNGTDTLAVVRDGTISFPTELQDGASYDVTVSYQPATQTCTVTNGTGTVSGGPVIGPAVNCVDNVVPPVDPPAPAVPVPTLSQWALILLSMLLGLMVFSNRKRIF